MNNFFEISHDSPLIGMQQEPMEILMKQTIIRIFDMCIEINGLNARQRKTTENLPTIFFEFSGHIASVCIHIHKNGWDGEDEPERFEFWTNGEFGYEMGNLREIGRTINVLESLKNEIRERGDMENEAAKKIE